jgi:multidrug efflux pump subunit AcrB
MKLTASALNSSRLTFFVAALVLVAGLLSFLKFPSQEEPSTTIRDALVFVSNPGLPAERMEQLVARPLEQRLRELPEIKHVVSTVRTGTTIAGEHHEPCRPADRQKVRVVPRSRHCPERHAVARRERFTALRWLDRRHRTGFR